MRGGHFNLRLYSCKQPKIISDVCNLPFILSERGNNHKIKTNDSNNSLVKIICTPHEVE